MFKKIGTHNFTLTVNDYGKLKDSYTKEIDGVARGSFYYELLNNDIRKQLVEMVGSGSELNPYDISIMVLDYPHIPPHIDNQTITTVNFYIDTAGATTTFYEDINTDGEKLANHTTGALFDKSNLTETSSFVAEPGDVYVLDIRKIHSVDFADENVKRVALVVQSTEFTIDDFPDSI